MEVNWYPDDDMISVSEILGTSTTKDEEDQKERDDTVREGKLVTPEPHGGDQARWQEAAHHLVHRLDYYNAPDAFRAGGAEKHTAILVIGCDLLMLTGGIVRAMIVPKEKSSVFFVIMVTALQVDVAKGTVLERPADVQQLFSYRLTIISWSGYPVVVLLGRAHFGLISKGMEDALLCILDCISKMGMEFFVVISCSGEGAQCHAKDGK
eukprot:s2896_g7.t1